MIVFAGRKEKGFFLEETEEGREKTAYVPGTLHIAEQAEAVLSYKEEADAVVFDIEQYADEPENVVLWMKKIQDAIRAKIIVFCPGYSPKSTLIRQLFDNGIQNFIFSVYLGDQKEDLSLCLNGYYESFGYEEKRGISFEEEENEEAEPEETVKTVCIGVAGCLARMGTTTQAVQLVKFFAYAGKKAAYVEMNTHHWVEALKEAYADVETDSDMGRVTYQGVDMFYRSDRLPKILRQGYDYLVFDYGVYSENGFNKISFLEKEKQIFVVGSKPGGEFEATYQVLKNNFYSDCFYVFNFVAKTEEKDILELMEQKADMTFFAGTAKDPFSFSGNGALYERLMPEGEKDEKKHKRKKKKHRGFFG